jgi:beta-lactamase regulating signal transducer with metallopeptidase domain
MSEAFLKVVNMSISAGWLVLAVLALRLILKKAPKWVNVLLWGIVAVRLICPFSIESALSLIPSTETISPEIMMDWTPEISTGIEPLDQVVNPVISTSFAPQGMASANPLQILIPVAANLWLLGILILLAYTAISYLTLRHKLRTAVILRDNIFQCETVSSPFVLGIVKPRIYLPYAMDGKNLGHVVAHEQAHIRRKDHWWKPLGFLLLTVYWFNPLMWIAYILLCRDIELACDEKVIAELGNEQRADYTQALVACAVNRRMIAACPLAFGEVGVKERVKSVMNYKKPAFWIIVVALIICVVVAVCFLTNPLDSVDYLKFTGWSNDPAYPDQMNYEINLGNRAMSGQIYVEQWTNGTCVRSAPVVMTQFVDSIHITVRDRWDAGTKVGTEINVETNQYGGTLTTYFPYPEDYDGACHYARNELNKRIKLSPDQELILEARSFQCGNGIRPFDVETLITNPELLKSQDCILIIRAVFSDDALGVTNENEASSPVTVLRAKILEVHDGYFLVEPVEGSWELSSASRIEVPIRNMSPSPEPQVGDFLQIEYDGEILETYPARLNKVYHIALERTVYYPSTMIPSDTDRLGYSAGALLVPIDGNIYRYLVSVYEPEGVTVDELLLSFEEPDLNGTIRWEVYSLQEYPDYLNVMVLSDRGEAWICCYFPPNACSDNALSEAIIAGNVVMEDGIGTNGQDIWKEFYESVQQGKAASVTVAHYFTLDPERCDSEYYEVYSQDYPCLYEYHLEYDGKTFTLTEPDGNDVRIRTFEYLMKYDNTEFYSQSSLTPGRRFDYVLTHDNRVTWEEIWNGFISSYTGADIDCYSIYSESIE